MDTINKIFVQINDERIELTGKALEDFFIDRVQLQTAETARQAELDAKVAARESAIAKLSALGLSEDEIKALVGA